MSQPTTGASDLISLPKGGGAVQGLGEKFQPDLHSGTGNCAVPIAIPAGRNGVHPVLTLGYSSGGGSSPFGLGWSLPIPEVRRQTADGVPRWHEDDDFILSGVEDLVPLDGDANATRYRPRTEMLFARIIRHHPPSQPGWQARDHYWTVESPDGTVSTYGTPRPSGAPNDWRDPAAISNPDDPGLVFAWKLTRSRDPFGNTIEYLYERDTSRIDGPHRWDQLYLSEIRYVDYGPVAAPSFLISVRFTYAARPDPFSDYRAGFEIRTVRRCTRIGVESRPGGTATPVRTYHLRYLDEQPGALLPLDGVSLLAEIQVEGHDGPASQTLPPLSLDYTQFAPALQRARRVSGPDFPAGALGDPRYDLVDLSGSGLPDLVQLDGVPRYWRNLGDGRFALPREMRDAPAGLALGMPGVRLLDADGDGRLDLMVSGSGMAGYYPLQFDGTWNRRSFQRYRAGPTFALDDPEVRLVDLDGDGVTDALRSGSRLECYFNDPIDGWGETRFVERQRLPDFPDVSFTDPRVRLADMTGDGLQDIVVLHDRNVEYWPALGRGAWAKRVAMTNAPALPWDYDPRRILLGDVDGDGFADLLYVGDGEVTLWVNRSGNSWSAPVTITGTPLLTENTTLRLVDLLGSGVEGVLWSADEDWSSRGGMFFLDLTAGAKPGLLSSIDNGLGATTRVEYAPSTRFFLEDNRRLATRWRTTLPLPLQVVARTEMIDRHSHGKLTSEYRYHHGYRDGIERHVEGFGRVDRYDSESFAKYAASGLHGNQPFAAVAAEFFSPPTLTKTWFHQGAVGDAGQTTELDLSPEYWGGDAPMLGHREGVAAALATLDQQNATLPTRQRRRIGRDALRALRGCVLRSELYAVDGTAAAREPYSVVEHAYQPREIEAPGIAARQRRRIFAVEPSGQRTTQWERGTDPMTSITFVGDYDAYGHARHTVAVAVPRGRNPRISAAPSNDPLEQYLVLETRLDFAQRDDAQRYIVNRLSRATSWEIHNDGSEAAGTLNQKISAGMVTRTISAQRITYFDGAAFQGLPYGTLGDYGVPVRTEMLVLTPNVLLSAYGTQRPPYLDYTGPVAWPTEYPAGFRALQSLAGYRYQPGGVNSQYAQGYFATIERHRYDFHDAATGRGLLTATLDPLGRETRLAYDAPYALLLSRVRDAVGLDTSVTYDYRAMQPTLITDPNGNRTAYEFTPLGMTKAVWVQGKGTTEGDQQSASLSLEYELQPTAGPAFVRSVRRSYHDTQAVPTPELDSTVETREYSDGFGRLLYTKTSAASVGFGSPPFDDAVLPTDQTLNGSTTVGRTIGSAVAPRVLVGGWQTHDNKGRVVETFEPFFDEGWDFHLPTASERRRSAATYYDARGQVVRTLYADGSEQRVVYGIPADVGDPSTYSPTPWELYTYDANDNAGRTHGAAANNYRHHFNTPVSRELDALGRTISVTQRQRSPAATAGGALPPIDEQRRTFSYDIRGNLLTEIDALGRTAFSFTYDLANRPIRNSALDAGTYTKVFDAAGQAIEIRDDAGALVLQVADVIGRSSRLWARDSGIESVTLRQVLEYGDAGDPAQPTTARSAASSANTLGRLVRQFDEAGLLELEQYDLHGNVVEKTRRVFTDARLLSVFQPGVTVPAPMRADWAPGPGQTLDDLLATDVESITAADRVSAEYDAIGRIRWYRYPRDVNGTRRMLEPGYDESGALSRITIDGAVIVERIAYNARGQRLLLALGNGVMTRYAYDTAMHRLVRLRSERFDQPALLSYRPTGSVRQDIAYAYDTVGNLMAIKDRTPDAGIAGSALGADALDRDFEYDALYRLLTATGRECQAGTSLYPWDGSPRCSDPTQVRSYIQRFAYDRAGNLEQIKKGTYVRQFGFAPTAPAQPSSNRVATLTIGLDVFAYSYDGKGNLTVEGSSRRFEWDHANRLRAFRIQAAGAVPTLTSHHFYDPAGQRVLKLVQRQGSYDVTVYIDGVFERQRWAQGTTGAGANTRVHIMAGDARVATWRTGDNDDQRPDVQYHLADHLGSSGVIIGGSTEAGRALIDREEFYPFGETSFGSFARKRFRFTGKELDEESGLYYHGARYYAPWLARWSSCDPIGLAGGSNAYVYASQNPLGRVDPAGQADVSVFVGTSGGSGLTTTAEITKDVATGVQTYAYSAPSSGAAVATGSEVPVIAGAAEGTTAASAPATAGGIGVAGTVALTAAVAIAVVGAFAAFAYCYLGNDRYGRMARELNEKRRAMGQDKGPMKLPGLGEGTIARTPGVPGDTSPRADPKGDVDSVEAPGSDIGRNFSFPGVEIEGEVRLAAGKSKSSGTSKKRAHNRTFMKQMLERILKTPGHPLRMLVDVDAGNWLSRRQDADTPTVQAGHLESLHGGAPERLALEDSTFNQVSSNVGETQGAIFHKTAIGILDIPVELRTARLLEGAGLLPPGTVANAPIVSGWIP